MSEAPYSGPERRQTPRKRVSSITYINFGPNNGGVLSNISDGGLCFHAVGPIEEGEFRIWLSAGGHRTEADVVLAWRDGTKKTGGLRFSSVSPQLRKQIVDWTRESTALSTTLRKPTQAPQTRALPIRSTSESHTSSVPDGFATSQQFPPERKAALQGFFPGLCTGLLVAAFVAAAFLLHGYRRQFGESLVSLGLRFGAEQQAQMLSPQPSASPLTDIVRAQRAKLKPATSATLASDKLSKPSAPKTAVTVNSIAASHELGKPTQAEPANHIWSEAQIPELAPANSSLSPALESIGFTQPGARDIRDVRPYTNSSAGEYFEAGKFRDGLRANQAIDKLGQSGFRAIIVPTRVLWMNSYHVLVGPYSNQSELEAARHSLESRGFNPRVLQNRSRHFSLPPITLYGTDVTVRDCIITWQLNSPDATVDFVQGRTVVATSKAKWEKRDFAFKTDAIVSLENEHGPATLVEIQRAGTDQGLLLEGSVLRFYLAR